MFQRRQSPSIRLKIVIIASITLFVTLGSVTFISSYFFAQGYSSLLEMNTRILAQDLRTKLEKLLDLQIDIAALVNFDKQCDEVIQKYEFVTYAMVINPTGRVLYHNDSGKQGADLYLPAYLNALEHTDYSVNIITRDAETYHEILLPVFTLPEDFLPGQTEKGKELVGFVCIGFPYRIIREKIKPMILMTGLIGLISFSLSLFLLLLALSRWITNPIMKLVSVIRNISLANNIPKQVKIQSDDEVGQLGRTFNAMTSELHTHKQILIEKQRMEKELEIATMIQTSLLPETYAGCLADYEIDARMIPATEVGGDYYDIIRDADENIWIGIGDVTGHGVRSGLVMMMLQTAAIAFIHNIPGLTPKDLIVKTNKVLYENIRNRLKTKHFMTLSFFKANSRGEFVFAGKHLPAIIYRRSEEVCELIDVSGFWLGFFPDLEQRTFSADFILNPGDMLFLYSDGIIEAMDQQRRPYGFEKFTRYIVKNLKQAGDIHPRVILDAVITDVFAFQESQMDDITLLVIKKR